MTTTLNDTFGSHVTAGSLGFLLNDEMDDFASKMGVPNMFGLIQGPANAIAPGKRPLSSMTPTIVLEDGKLRYVLGSPGGARIITTVGKHLPVRSRRRTQYPAGGGRAPFPPPVPAGQALPGSRVLAPDYHCRAAQDGLRAQYPRRPLVKRRVHCGGSQDR